MDEAELDTMSPLEMAAVHANEFYLALVKAGFTEEQALALVIGLIRQNQKQAE